MKREYIGSKGYTPVECPQAIPPKRNYSTGYTLVELLIVIASFVIIVVTAVDLFASMVSHQRKVLTEQELLSQTSYVVEYMSRALRMAVKAVDTSCINEIGRTYQVNVDKNSIKFFNGSSNVCQTFFLDAGRIEETKDAGIPIALTGGSLSIKEFNVEVYGDTASDLSQPRVVIAIDIEKQVKGFQIKKNIQITVSQRNLNLNEE